MVGKFTINIRTINAAATWLPIDSVVPHIGRKRLLEGW